MDSKTGAGGARSRTTGARRRRTGTGVVLSEEAIVDAALHLIELRGAEHLSARTLGAARGADPTALYRYFDGMDDLQLAVADRLIGIALDRWGPAEDDWIESLRRLGWAFYRVYVLDYPHSGRNAAARVTRRPNEIRVVETVLGILRTAGFDDATAVERFQVLVDFILAFAALDSTFATMSPQARDADVKSWTSAYAALSPETHPNIAATAELLASRMADDSFEPALEMLLAGLKTLPRSRGGAKGPKT